MRTVSLFMVATMVTLLNHSSWAQSPANKPPAPVQVVNFPVSQAVTGAVQVSNFPTEQNVSLQNAVLTVMMLPPPRFQLVGFTSASANGGSGVLELTRLCQQDFPESRMCTSEEVASTVQLPDLPPETDAFVRPVPGGASARQVRDDETNLVYPLNVPYDSASGVTPISQSVGEEMSCHGWRHGGSTHSGLTVDSSGRFDVMECVPRPVACCALVQ